MTTLVALLRGINLGSTNRIAMPELRSALADAGFENVRTYVQSGNILLDTELQEGALAEIVATLIADRFALAVPVVVRGAAELAEVVAEQSVPRRGVGGAQAAAGHFPLVAGLPADVAERRRGASDGVFSPDTEAISLALSRRNVYGWHPQGIHVSKLARDLSDRKLGVIATARNWTTVTTLLEMASTDVG